MDNRTKFTIGGVAIAGVIAGAALTAALPAVAAGTPTPSASSDASTADPSQGGHQANGVTEKLLTGDSASKARDAVLAKYPGATVQRVENDAEGAAYEAHILQADGTPATVKLDASFTVTGLEAGGPGGGHEHHGGPGDGDSDGAGTGTGSSSDSGSAAS